jgi:hypothetical protein
MTLERWKPEKHLPLVHEWARLRGLGPNAGDVSLLPPTGFVADGIVAGFLYVVTGCKQAFMDGFVSDPRATREQRGQAIHEIMDAIVVEARELGIRALCGAISVPSLALHVEACGFTVLKGCSYVYRGL